MKKILITLFSLTLFATTSAMAGEGKTRLDKFLKGLKTLDAELVQTQYDANGDMLDEGEGSLLVERPGRFRLHYVSPYDMLYVADGKQIWVYDHDLEQVTVKPQGDALGSTPAMLLSGTTPLEKNFTIKELGKHEGFYWLELKPKAEDSSFDYMRLAIEENTLRAMEMVDSFGQTTRLYFRTVKRNGKLPEGSFNFTPPEGVDVIGEGQ